MLNSTLFCEHFGIASVMQSKKQQSNDIENNVKKVQRGGGLSFFVKGVVPILCVIIINVHICFFKYMRRT